MSGGKDHAQTLRLQHEPDRIRFGKRRRQTDGVRHQLPRPRLLFFRERQDVRQQYAARREGRSSVSLLRADRKKMKTADRKPRSAVFDYCCASSAWITSPAIFSRSFSVGLYAWRTGGSNGCALHCVKASYTCWIDCPPQP